MTALNRATSTGSSTTHSPRMRVENRPVGFPGSLGRRISRQLRGAGRDGRLDPDVELGPLLAVADLSSPARTARRSGGTASVPWTKVYAGEVRDGRLASMCEFDLEDEEAAFAYAEERMRASASRLRSPTEPAESGRRLAGDTSRTISTPLSRGTRNSSSTTIVGDSVVTRSRTVPGCGRR